MANMACSAAEAEQAQSDRQHQIGNPALYPLLQAECLLHPFRIAQIIEADADLVEFRPVDHRAAASWYLRRTLPAMPLDQKQHNA
jgi:hypothetical protein